MKTSRSNRVKLFYCFALCLLCTVMMILHTRSEPTMQTETDCLDCIRAGNVWCALTNKCEVTVEGCRYKYNVTWFVVNRATFGQEIPDHCNNGIFRTEEQCPTTHLLLERGGSYSENLKYPLGIQPRVLFDANITSQYKDLIVGNYFYEKDVRLSAKPFFFSFNYHVDNNLPVDFEMANGRIKYRDLSVASDPKRIWQKADFQWIYQGPHLYAGFPVITLALILVSSTFLCCVNKFHIKKLYHGEDGEHTVLPKRVFLPNYPTTGKYSIKEILHSLLFASDSQIIEKCGTDAYYYLWFQKYLIFFALACACVSMPILLPMYYFSDDHEISFKDFAGFTIAALDVRRSYKLIVVYLVIMAFAALGCVYLYFLRKLARTLVKANKNFSSLFTVMVSNVSPKLRNPKQLMAQFQDRYGDCVVDAQICYDLRELTRLDQLRDKYTSLLEHYQEHLDKTGQRATVRTGFLWLSNQDALSYYHGRLMDVQAKIDKREHSKSKLYGTGYGFVTFSSIKMAQKCLTDHAVRFCGISIPLWFLDNRWDYSVEPAPESDDVNYQNLPYSGWRIWLRSVITNSIMSVILFTVYAIVYGASLLHWYKSTHASNIWDVVSKYTIAIILQAFVELIPELISAVTEIVKPLLEVLTSYEKHHTRFGFRRSVVRKTAFFMCLSVVVLPYFYTYVNGVWGVCFKAKAPFNNYIYYFNHIGIEMITICIVLSTIAKSIELAIVFLRMMLQLWREKKMERPEYDYDGNYGFKISFMLLMLVFGAITPLTMPFVLFFFGFTYWVDKYLIMFFYDNGHESDGRVVNTVADVSSYYISVFPIYILCILPSLFLSWKTWVILVPFLILLTFVLRYLYRQAKVLEVEKIVLGIKEASQDEETDTMSTVEDGSMTNEDQDDSMNFENDDQIQDNSMTSKRRVVESGLAARILSAARAKSIGPETRLSYDDIENTVSQEHLLKMARRYKHPYLRKQVALRRHDLTRNYEEQEQEISDF